MRCNTLIGGFILNDAEGVNCIPLLQPPCDIVSFILFVYTLHLLHTAALIFISIIGPTVGTQTQFLHPRMLNCVSQDIRYLPNSSVANYLCCSASGWAINPWASPHLSTCNLERHTYGTVCTQSLASAEAKITTILYCSSTAFHRVYLGSRMQDARRKTQNTIF